jgi:hypothetical protein
LIDAHGPLYQLSAVNYQLSGSRHCQELLPNAQLQKLRKENLGDKNFVGRKLAGRDCFVVLDPLGRVN